MVLGKVVRARRYGTKYGISIVMIAQNDFARGTAGNMPVVAALPLVFPVLPIVYLRISSLY